MATCHTAKPADADQQLLVDIDLAILGAEPARFAEYEPVMPGSPSSAFATVVAARLFPAGGNARRRTCHRRSEETLWSRLAAALRYSRLLRLITPNTAVKHRPCSRRIRWTPSASSGCGRPPRIGALSVNPCGHWPCPCRPLSNGPTGRRLSRTCRRVPGPSACRYAQRRSARNTPAEKRCP